MARWFGAICFVAFMAICASSPIGHDPFATDNCNVTCRKKCNYGFLMDGCPRCTCAPDPCQTMKCAESETCETTPSTDCGVESCPDAARCVNSTPIVNPMAITGKRGSCEATTKRKCRFGFKEKGCPRNKCVNNPCKKKKCKKGKTCVTVPKKCVFKTGCPHRAKCVKVPKLNTNA